MDSYEEVKGSIAKVLIISMVPNGTDNCNDNWQIKQLTFVRCIRKNETKEGFIPKATLWIFLYSAKFVNFGFTITAMFAMEDSWFM